jgi:predicted RNA-binding Zn-ribbon protein involved in translation (DUF1610 family)
MLWIHKRKERAKQLSFASNKEKCPSIGHVMTPQLDDETHYMHYLCYNCGKENIDMKRKVIWA